MSNPLQKVEILRFWPRSKVAKAALFFIVAIIFAKDGFYSSDVQEMFVQSSVLHENHSIFLDAQKEAFPEARWVYGRDHHIYSKYGIGYPLLSAAYIKVLKVFRADRILTHRHNFFIPNVFFFILSAYLLALMLRQLNAGSSMNTVTVVAYLFSTHLSFYSAGWPANSFEAVLLFIAFYWFFMFTQKPERSDRYVFYSGCTVAYAGLSRVLPFVTIPIFILAILFESKLTGWKLRTVIRRVAVFCIPNIIAIVLHFVINFIKTGHWHSTYASYEKFDVPFYIGFLGSMLWPGKSFIFFAPVTLLSVFGLCRLYFRSKSLFLLCVSISAVYIVMMSKWWAWNSGADIGQRFWIPAIPFLLFPIAFIEKTSLRFLAIILVAIGVFVQGLQYQSDPGRIYVELTSRFPYAETTENVRKVIHGELPRVIKTTFWDLNYFRYYRANP